MSSAQLLAKTKGRFSFDAMIKKVGIFLIAIIAFNLSSSFAQSITGIAGIQLGEDISNYESCDKDYPVYLVSYHCQPEPSGHNIDGVPVEGFSFIFNEDKKLELIVASVQEDKRLLDILKSKFNGLKEISHNTYRYYYGGASVKYSINYQKEDPKAAYIPKRSDMKREDVVKVEITDYRKWKKSSAQN